MPELVNSSVGSLAGTSELEGTIVWPLARKNSRNAERISEVFMADRDGMVKKRGHAEDAVRDSEFSIELFARIVHFGAGNGPYCRRIEAAAQEKLRAAAAFGAVGGGLRADSGGAAARPRARPSPTSAPRSSSSRIARIGQAVRSSARRDARGP